MSIDSWMDKKYVVNVYSGILFDHEKDWDLAIYDMNEPMGKKITMWYHLQVESKNQNKWKSERNLWMQEKKKLAVPRPGGNGFKKQVIMKMYTFPIIK